jgi:hypothetical protein
MLTDKRLVNMMLKRPAVRAAYKAVAPAFALLDERLRERRHAGHTRSRSELNRTS